MPFGQNGAISSKIKRFWSNKNPPKAEIIVSNVTLADHGTTTKFFSQKTIKANAHFASFPAKTREKRAFGVLRAKYNNF